MSQTKTTPKRGGGDGTNLGKLPDARVTIDLEERADGWIAYDPDDGEGIVGRGETAPRAAEDYARRVAEFLEQDRSR